MLLCEAQTLHSDHAQANVWCSTIKDKRVLLFYGYWREQKTKEERGFKKMEGGPKLKGLVKFPRQSILIQIQI